jgi:hypothetical protein
LPDVPTRGTAGWAPGSRGCGGGHERRVVLPAGAAIFSLGESKQTAVFFLVLALVAAAGVIYLRWRASDDNRPQGPAPGAVC